MDPVDSARSDWVTEVNTKVKNPLTVDTSSIEPDMSTVPDLSAIDLSCRAVSVPRNVQGMFRTTLLRFENAGNV